MKKYLGLLVAFALLLASPQLAHGAYASGTPKATTAEAQAGTNNTKFMTPALVKSAMQAQGNYAAGYVVGRSYTEDAQNTNYATALGIDDTAVTIAEGAQVITANYTAQAASNRLRIEFNAFISGSAVATACALFNDSADAVQVTAFQPGSISIPSNVSLQYEFSPGNTSSHAYSVRCGANGGGTLRANGTTSGRWFNGAAKTTLTITEFKG